MRYMLLIHADPAARAVLSQEESEKIASEYATFTRSLIDSGEMIAGAPLEGTDTATTVRLRDGEPVPSDGPFAETKEYLCGFYLVDCADLDRAIDLAGRVPGIQLGSVEVRPVWEAAARAMPAPEASAEVPASVPAPLSVEAS